MEKELLKENFSKDTIGKKLICGELFREAKIHQQFYKKCLLHKVGSKDSIIEIHRFILFHLVEGILFDLPHTIYMNISKNFRRTGEFEDITYATLLNKLL